MRPNARLVACVVALIGAISLAACASSETASDETPGFDGSGRTVDTRPFERAAASERGATTLPEGFFEPKDPNAPTTTLPPTTTTTLPPTTTTSTTTTLPTPVVPGLGSVNDLCGFSSYMSSFYGISDEDPPTVERKVNAVVEVLRRLIEVAPPEAAADVQVIAAALTDLRDVLRSVDWNPRSSAYRARLQQYIDGSDGRPNINVAINRVMFMEGERC